MIPLKDIIKTLTLYACLSPQLFLYAQSEDSKLLREPYQKFLASLSYSASSSQLRFVSTEKFQEKKLLHFLSMSGAKVKIPKNKNQRWSDYAIEFPAGLSLFDAEKHYALVIGKIETNNDIEGKQASQLERQLAKTILDRDLLKHYLRGEEFVSLETNRKRLIELGSVSSNPEASNPSESP